MPTPPPIRTWQAVALLALCLLLLCAHAWRYYPFLADDALISLHYAQRLLQGKGLTWDSFHPVEGYSNLLWTLGAAGLGALGFDLIVGVRLMGVASMGAMLGGIVWFGTRWRRDKSLWPSLGAGLVCACSGTLAVWVVGGLEQTLVAACLTLATVCMVAWNWRADAAPTAAWVKRLGQGALIALVLTRPDSPLLVAALAAGYVVGSTRPKKRAVIEALGLIWPSIVAYLGVLGFRLVYYGEWVPNTAYVKIALTSERLKLGWGYVSSGLWTYWPLWLALVLFVQGKRPLPWRRLVIIGLPALTWCVYVVFIGGDIFPGRRHLAPLVPLFALILSEVMASFEAGEDASERVAMHQMIGIRVSFALGAFLLLQWEDHAHGLAISERWEWTCKEVATDLKLAFEERDPLFAVTAAGCFPYWTQFRSLDLLGLNDHHIARHPPEGFGKGFLAHDLGDPVYTWGREPDLIHSGVPGGGSLFPHFGIGASQMQQMPEFPAHYAPMYFEGQGYGDQLHVRYTSARVGIRREEHGVFLPAHLFANIPQVRARVDAQHHRFTVPLHPSQTLTSPPVFLAAGVHTVQAEGADPGTRIVPKSAKPGAIDQVPTAGNPMTFRLREDAPVTFTLITAPASPGVLQGLSVVAPPPR